MVSQGNIAPDFTLARKLLGMALLRQHCYREALPHLRQALDACADDPQCYYLLGFDLAHLGCLEDPRRGGGSLRIPVIPATQSGAKLPPHPKEACHAIRTKAAPHRSSLGAQRRLS